MTERASIVRKFQHEQVAKLRAEIKCQARQIPAGHGKLMNGREQLVRLLLHDRLQQGENVIVRCQPDEVEHVLPRYGSFDAAADLVQKRNGIAQRSVAK